MRGVRRALALEGGKTAVIFPTSLGWDVFTAPICLRVTRSGFETMKVAYANCQVNWIACQDPSGESRQERTGTRRVRAVRSTCHSLARRSRPSHVRIIQPDSNISTLSLYRVMDYCVTVRNVGIEAASFGIPVFTAGTGRYDRRGFTIDLTREEYLDRLRLIRKRLCCRPINERSPNDSHTESFRPSV